MRVVYCFGKGYAEKIEDVKEYIKTSLEVVKKKPKELECAFVVTGSGEVVPIRCVLNWNALGNVEEDDNKK